MKKISTSTQLKTIITVVQIIYSLKSRRQSLGTAYQSLKTLLLRWVANLHTMVRYCVLLNYCTMVESEGSEHT